MRLTGKMVCRHILAPIFLGMWVNWVQAASFADLAAWKEVTLLNERIRVALPEAAQLRAPNNGIMEAPPPPEKQQRVMVDAGNLRLVAFAEELFRVAPENFMSLGKTHVKTVQERYGFEELSVANQVLNVGGLEILEFQPRGKATVSGAHMISGVLIRQIDGTLQQIGFFVNDAGLKDLPAAKQLVMRIITSLKPGPRKLASGMRLQLSVTPLTLALPREYAAYTQRGPDFNVYWVEHIVAVNEPAGRMGIYSGDHPQEPKFPATARAMRATLFGVAAEWKIWQETQGAAVTRQETLLRTLNGHVDGRLHIFIRAVSEEERVLFQRIAETATLQ